MKVVRGKPNGHVLTFPAGEFLIGRGPECDIRPNSELVSRQHCQLQIREQDAVLRDLGSRNGTLVNGRRVIGEVPLNVGDSVQIGPLSLEVLEQTTIDGDIDTMLMNDTISHPDEPPDEPAA